MVTPASRALWAVEEPLGRRVLFGTLMAGVLVLYAMCLSFIWYPAHPGVDQNGYLVGGKLLALTGNTGVIPPNPFSFVGAMWNLGPDGKTFYPKYPLGLPAIYAAAILILGEERGPWWAHLASPAGAVLAMWGTYVLARPLVGAFGAVLTMLVLGTSPIMVGLATNPNSHATTLAFAVWGMAMLFAWWHVGGWWRATLAGLFAGYALTIRYTEGLLLLPMAMVFLDRWFRRERGAYWEGLLMFAAWAVPVGILLWWNLLHFGSPTGYDSTRESMGFGWVYFVANWDLMLRDMNDKGLVLLFPLGLAGMGLMAAAGKGTWKVGAVLAAWAVPCLITYTAYYWAPDSTSLGYSRFFLTVLPAIAVAGVWVLVRAGELIVRGLPERSGARRWAGGAVVAGSVAGLGACLGAGQNADTIIPESRQSMLVALAGDGLEKIVPPKSVLFSEARLMHHLQFVSDHEMYGLEVFSRAAVQRLQQAADVNDPHPLQPQRASALYALLKDKTEAQLIAEQQRIMDDALASGRRVFFILPKNQMDQNRRRFLPAARYETKTLKTWQEPADFRRDRWQRAGANPPPWAANRRRQPTPADRGQLWEVVEVTRKPPPPPPVTRPAVTRPAVTRPVGTRPAVTRPAVTTRPVTGRVRAVER